MTRSIFSKVMWVGRATVFVVGLAVIVALTVGLATTALAGTGVGARFQLGQTNTVNAITKLVGSVAGPSLQIDNNSTNANATALDLQVEAGKAPMKVNSDTNVANLNADKLDGLDSGAFLGANGTAANADKLDNKDSSEFLGTVPRRPPTQTSSAGWTLPSSWAPSAAVWTPSRASPTARSSRP
jgi:hypothetical protein